MDQQGVAPEAQYPMPTLGAFYYVQRADDSWHVAEIIQKRENAESKRTEFYVHYKECKNIDPLHNYDVIEVEGGH